MLQFLRQIRHRILNKNQSSGSASSTGRYILYALGEIFLVMIGILLALQVNNWNEHRKERKEESYFLLKLKNNIADDISMLEATINTNRDFITLTDLLLIILSHPSEYDREDFGKRLRVIRHFRSFFPMKITFDNIVSSGKIDLIQNQDLSEKLFLYYRYIDEYTRSNNAALANLSRNIMTPYFLEFDYWDSFAPTLTSNLMDKYKYPFKFNKKSIQAFADDPFIPNVLQEKIARLERHIEVYQIIKKDAKEILQILELELNKK